MGTINGDRKCIGNICAKIRYHRRMCRSTLITLILAGGHGDYVGGGRKQHEAAKVGFE